ncbi:branched-chain amino acid transport system II carrier protein [Virgibacillus sp. SK37]|uniref:branched-chain amino acid transport system II carrier protein n=1 Tax=Virgibacillus sp. SK37 TaxID=403957 RepID=UPI0011AA6028|nr:branched-chain amino acid transport system II carrier protein [Virgibacillus sp. SK37]
MSKKHVVFIGFMLFSLFFGAGNLIFPPIVGLESGSQFTPAITGFLITGVLLPFFAVLAVALTDGGIVAMGSRVHKVFGIIFAILVYLSIGALFGIPRAANVAYELGFQQVLHANGQVALLVFSIIFFGITYYITLNPSKIVDRVGQILTPILLITLAILFVRAFMILNNPPLQATEKYTASPFTAGFLEGYFTMDAIAALAFGIVVINALKGKGATTNKQLIKGTISAGVVAAAGLAIVYVSLGWIGVVIPKTETFENGAQILTLASHLLFASTGSLLFGVIVILACLTTCVGLISACASFFHEIYPKLGYKSYATVFTLLGFSVATFGLDAILSFAVPLLVFIYPIAIVLIILSIAQRFLPESKTMFRLSVLLTTIYSVYEVLSSIGLKMEMFTKLIGFVPFFENGLGWFVPAVVAAIVGFVVDRTSGPTSEATLTHEH